MNDKVKEVFKTLFWPLLLIIGQYFILFLFMLVYIISNPKFDVNAQDAINVIINYIDKNTLLILLVQCIIFIPLFWKLHLKYKCSKLEVNFMTIFRFTVCAALLSTMLNFLIIGLKHLMNIDMISQNITTTVIIGTGIIGPILEELLFRGIVYEKFNKVFEDKVAFYLSVFIFAIVHTGGIFQILFAFIIGCFLTYIYKRYHDIRVSIIAHMTVNLTSILISPLILGLF